MEYKILKQSDLPEKLRNIKKAPKILYAIGNVNLLYEQCFGIVGTRNPTEYGRKVCKEFSKEFALREIPLVSGMAIGIDQIAHRTTLEYNSKTIGILGCGFEHYLSEKENVKLFSEIIEKDGLILSEYDLTVEKSKENFPQRNRIIAAISEGVLVVEAAFRSGSSITAKWAKEYEKTVFAVPGKINEKMSVGTNNLIKNGAILSTDIEDVLKRYPQFVNKKRKNIENFTKRKQILKKDWKEIISLLKKENLIMEELKFKTKKDIRTLMKILSEMELEGIIEYEIGIGYKILNR